MKKHINSIIILVILAYAFLLSGCNSSINNPDKNKEKNTNTPVTSHSTDIPQDEQEKELDSIEIPLTLEAITAGNIYLLSKNAFERISIQKNNGLIVDTAEIIEVQPGDKIHFYGNNYKYGEADPNSLTNSPVNLTIKCTADCYVYGNVMSLLYYTKFTGKTQIPDKYAFQKFFQNNTHIKNHEILDIVLPATTLSDYCYANMFQGCSGLTRAPELPATKLAKECYSFMFCDCEKLNYIKCLATDISAADCTKDWLNGVAANGTFTKYTSMTNWPTGETGIPSGWTVIDAE